MPGPGTPGTPGHPGTTLPPITPNMPTSFSSYIDNRVAFHFRSADLYIRRHGNEILYNYQSLIEDELSRLSGDAKANWFNAASVAAQINLSNYSNLTGNVLISQVPNASMLYNTVQLSLLNTYVGNMYSATSGSTATSYYNATVAAINSNTLLSSEQKKAALAVVDLANRFAQNFFSGAYNQIITDITNLAGRSTSGSCVNWKSAWRNAVVGGVAAGAYGAYVGATGGTVALPGLGTVSGGVAGGVFGFASGFIGSAVGSIATDVLFNCMGGASMTAMTDCARLYEDLEMRLQCEADHASLHFRWQLQL